MSEVEISNPNSLIKCSERRGRGGGEGGEEEEKKLVRFRVLTRFFTRCLHFIGKASRFSPSPPSLPPSLSFNSTGTPRSATACNGKGRPYVRSYVYPIWEGRRRKTLWKRNTSRKNRFTFNNNPNRSKKMCIIIIIIITLRIEGKIRVKIRRSTIPN